MKLYIANCTQQVQSFMYRVPETPAPRMQPIGIGQQIQISGDLSQFDIDAIVEQHSRYGLVAVDAIDRTRPFIGVCYSVDKHVPVDKIKRALEHNESVLIERGRVMRQEAAVALNNSLEEQTDGLKNLELTVQEEYPDKHSGDGPVIAEGIRVQRPENTGPVKRGRGRK